MFARERLGLADAAIRVVPHGVDPVFHAAEWKPEPGQLLFVGSWIARKGIRTLAAAFTALAPRHPEARLALVGVGAAEATVLASFPPELRGRIGVVPSAAPEVIAAWMARAAVVLFPSFSEGFGLVAAEAAAVGAPLVASPAGVVPDRFVRTRVRPRRAARRCGHARSARRDVAPGPRPRPAARRRGPARRAGFPVGGDRRGDRARLRAGDRTSASGLQRIRVSQDRFAGARVMLREDAANTRHRWCRLHR